VRRVLVVCIAASCACALLLGLAIASQRHQPAEKLVSGVSDDPAVAAILARSCQDCHSDRTRWPWYGRIPPASWLLNRDVAEGRSHMDFSLWSKYSPDDRRQILAQIAANVRGSVMPPGRYLLIHGDAELSADEIARLYAWTRSERSKLRAAAAKGESDSR
jgi:Haem-binding domain